MSRVGKKKIILPESVKVTNIGPIFEVTGPKGVLERKISKRILVKIENNQVDVSPKFSDKYTRGLHGLSRTLLYNMVVGVTEGFEKKLKFSGVGFRAQVQGDELVLNLGFSHPVNIKAPEGIAFKVEKNIITISGIDKEEVGEVAAKIRKIYPPEPYKGKGIAYIDEIIRRKPGKAVAASEGK